MSTNYGLGASVPYHPTTHNSHASHPDKGSSDMDEFVSVSAQLPKFCTECGWRYRGNDKFCGGCGRKRL